MPDKLTKALSRVKEEVVETNNSKELEYYQYHEKRFERMGRSILKKMPNGGRILDIGSHYLHSSMILTELGYEVYAVDVSEFWEISFIQKRMEKYSIEGIAENNLETFGCVDSMPGYFDGILFTEILEHITFNPIIFWNQVYKTIKKDGLIYLTTPNSFALPSLIRSFKNLISFRGIGIKVQDIFDHVTYGHHWKEYSRSEVKEYFHLLSNDFKVESRYFSFHKRTKGSFRDSIWQSLILLGSKLYFFAPTIEVFVLVNKGRGIEKSSPKYY